LRQSQKLSATKECKVMIHNKFITECYSCQHPVTTTNEFSKLPILSPSS
jgi:hypothetical protein